jgi:hypothetical protein
MRKKCLILLAAVLIGLSFHACSLPEINRPETITIKGSPEFDLLLNISGIDLGRIYIDMIRKQLADIGSDQFTIDIWEADYGQKEQAFLLKLSSTLTNSLNPDKYLDGAGFKHLDETSSEPFPINYSVNMSSIKIEKTVEVDFSPLLDLGGSGVVTIPAGYSLPQIDISNLVTIPENTTGFLHAVIKDVDYKTAFAEDPGGSVLTGINPDFTFNARQEDDDSYYGLTNLSRTFSPGELEGENINKKELRFSDGIIRIDPQGATLEISPRDSSAGTLKKNLTVTVEIKTLENVKWDFAKISEQFQADALKFPPYSLAEPAGYVKELHFDQNDETDNKGIGLKASFEEVIPGLLLNIKCEDIYVDATQDLKKGNIIFGNTDRQVDLELEEYKDDKKSLEYEIKLEPASGNVLDIGNLTLGKEQELIKGEVSFFHCWTKAFLDMNAIIKIANVGKDDFEGTVPDVFKEEGEPEEPIDLSMLKKYFEGGFTIDGIQTDVYMSGPGKAFDLTKLPNLEFSARLVSSKDEMLGGKSLYDDELKLGDPVTIDLNKDGYYDSKELPLKGRMHIDDAPFTELIEIILNEAPADLFFQYNLEMAEELEVTYEMFKAATDEEKENDVITVDVVVLLPLKLRVTDTDEGGLRVLFNEFIGEQSDLFGRKKPGEDTGFSNINPALSVSLEFSEQIFSGGTIFLFTGRLVEVEETEEVAVERERGVDPLFPDGIPLNGKSININVSGDTLNRVLGTTNESSLLILDPLVKFDSGDTITIPRNMGIMGIRLGISGDYTRKAEDLGFW